VTQETDFLGVNTMYTWDINRRLPLTTTEAATLPEARTTTTQWHASYRLPVLVTESMRTTAYTYDGAGNRLSQTVTDTASSTSRTTSWTYSTQGLPATVVAPGGVVAQSYAYYTDTAFSGTYDPYIDYVSLLLHGNGANGATVFTDSGRAPKMLTASGNAQISTAQSKYGSASLLLDGAGDYLTAPASADYEFGTGDFTIETWVYIAALPAAGGASQVMASVWDATGSKRSWQFLYRQTAGNVHNIIFSLSSNGSTSSGLTTTWTPSANTWYHIAVARQSGTTTIYLNGTSLGSNGTVTGAPYVSGRPITIGALGDSASIGHFLNGYLDDFRITKGVARYTANFTPPTQELPHNGPSPESTGHTIGDLQSVTNAAGHVTQFTQYDRAGRVRQMVDPKGIVTDLVYNPRGQIATVTVTPPGGSARTTAYTYDNVGQLTAASLPDGSNLGYSYDNAQRLTGVTDAKGNTVTYTLDNMGNRTGEQVKDSSNTLQRNITRVYDALNRVQQVTGASN
jgi:YD repeat-containing protein